MSLVHCKTKPYLVASFSLIWLIGCSPISSKPPTSVDEGGFSTSAKKDSFSTNLPQSFLAAATERILPSIATAPPVASPISTKSTNLNRVTSLQNLGELSQPIFYAPPIVIPAPAIEDEPEWKKLSFITSIIAILVSLSVAGYTINKDLRARRFSVEDEYWLRKIVGPIAVEPLLKSILEMIASTPDDNSSALYSRPAIDAFHAAQAVKFADLALNSSPLQLINVQLASEVAQAIDDIQDLMITYCGAQHHAPGSVGCQSKDSFQKAARRDLIVLLQLIKDVHTKL